MSRGIKFRAWSTTSKQMYPFTLDDCYQEGYDDGWDNADGAVRGNRLSYTAPDMVVMQYTGLKDKNGVEVYEGDVVNVGNGEGEGSRHEVRWGSEHDYPAFDLYPDLTDDCNGLQYACLEMNIEVIGNSYENPELLDARKGKEAA